MLDAALARVLDHLDPEATARETRRLETELGRLDGELRRLADVIATAGGDVPSLMTAIRAREHERVTVQGRLAELAATSQVARMDRVRLDRDLRHRLTDWQGLILEHPPQARQGLRKLLEGRLAFTPTEDGTAVEFSGQGRLDPSWSASSRRGTGYLKGACPRPDLPPLGCWYPSVSGYGQPNDRMLAVLP